MYPPVTQFQTRDALVRQELELRFGRDAARRSAPTSWWYRPKRAAQSRMRGHAVPGAELR